MKRELDVNNESFEKRDLLEYLKEIQDTLEEDNLFCVYCDSEIHKTESYLIIKRTQEIVCKRRECMYNLLLDEDVVSSERE